jgi:hypothetical protein
MTKTASCCSPGPSPDFRLSRAAVYRKISPPESFRRRILFPFRLSIGSPAYCWIYAIFLIIFSFPTDDILLHFHFFLISGGLFSRPDPAVSPGVLVLFLYI